MFNVTLLCTRGYVPTLAGPSLDSSGSGFVKDLDLNPDLSTMDESSDEEDESSTSGSEAEDDVEWE